MDFMEYLGADMSKKILSCLNDPSDLVRSSAVSRSWREFVIGHGLCKNLCLGMFPQLSLVDHVTEGGGSSSSNTESTEAESSNLVEQKVLEREHRAYAFLARGCTSFPVESCISAAVASSGQNISNTLESRNWEHGVPSIWISRGHQHPRVREVLLYKLVGDLCVVTDIGIRPFEARIQGRRPILSARYVRFRMGHRKACSVESVDGTRDMPRSTSFVNNFEWTYTSDIFPMVQGRRTQNFKLPEPALCVGRYLSIELLGCAERSKNLLYCMGIAHVRVMGRKLSKCFKADNLAPSGRFALNVVSYARPRLDDIDMDDFMVSDDFLEELMQGIANPF